MTSEDPWAHLTEENRARLKHILANHVNEVFKANRVIEQRTGYSSEIARNMMVDVLAHFATLAGGVNLSPEDQASQLAKIEEHLHRAMVEHPEEVIRNRIGDVDELWARYEREAFAYRESGALSGVPLHRELEEDRARIDVLLESARSRKPEESTWDETLTSASEMTEAAHLTRTLANKLEQCIGKAHQVRTEREQTAAALARETRRDRRTNWQWAVGIAVAVALAVAGFFLGKSSATTRTHPQNGHVTHVQTGP